jgi:2-dehydropantoate 2-reductase
LERGLVQAHLGPFPGEALKQVLIIGAGAIGGALCAYLEGAGRPATLLARGENARNIAEGGVRLTTPDNKVLHARPRVVTAADGLGSHDVVILATKSFSLPAAMAAAAPAIGPETIVVPVVNGVPWWFGTTKEPLRAVDPEGFLAGSVPYERLVGATIYAPMKRTTPTEWLHTGQSKLVIGPAAAQGSEDASRQIAELFRGAGLTTLIAADIHRAVWTKIMTNATFNTLCALTGARQCDVARDTHLGPVAREIMREIEALAIASGSGVEGTVDEPFESAREKGLFKPSTLQDIEAGRPLEIAALVDGPLELAQRYGVPMPALRVAGAALRAKAMTMGLLPVTDRIDPRE